eukprot:GHVT01058529.1.p1 GENE.GHVT01058529.1~~GHVT01058529.1.p1  ORF type:complete len:924 (+),score=93.17 GHVT01058529.1:6254-9025(+)
MTMVSGFVANCASLLLGQAPTDNWWEHMSKEDWTNLLTGVTQRLIMSMPCILTQKLGMTHAQSFLWTTIIFCIYPILLTVLAEGVVAIVVTTFKMLKKKSTQKKTALLQTAEELNLTTLSEQLIEEYTWRDRFLSAWRYIPLPRQTDYHRLMNFFEDSFTLRLVVFFFVYSKTTVAMLSTLDCQFLDAGRRYPPQIRLRLAPSVQCTFLQKPHFPYFFTGVLGLAVWTFGIPAYLFFVLLRLNKNNQLYTLRSRIKLGFLFSGYRRSVFWWETLMYLRKFLVLFVSSSIVDIILVGMGFFPQGADEYTVRRGKNIVKCIVAISFLLAHLVCKPYDESNYLVLDTLERHSLCAWTATVCIEGMFETFRFSNFTSLLIAITVLCLNASVLIGGGYQIVIAYLNNIRRSRMGYKIPLLGALFRCLGGISEARIAREPIVFWDNKTRSVQLVAAQRHRKWNLFKLRAGGITTAERAYFVKALNESISTAISVLQLDVLPANFIEFMIRLALVYQIIEERENEMSQKLKQLSQGKVDVLVEYLQSLKKQQNEREQMRVKFGEMAEDLKKENSQLKEAKTAKYEGKQSRSDSRTLKNQNSNAEKSDDDVPEIDDEIDAWEERLGDLEGGRNTEEVREDNKAEGLAEVATAQDEEELENIRQMYQSLTDSDMLETSYLFSSQVSDTGIALSDFYLAFIKLQLKDPLVIAQQFFIFQKQSSGESNEMLEKYRQKNERLRNLLDMAISIATSGENLEELGMTKEGHEERSAALHEQEEETRTLLQRLEELREHPEDHYDEIAEEWIEGDDELNQILDEEEIEEYSDDDDDEFEDLEPVDEEDTQQKKARKPKKGRPAGGKRRQAEKTELSEDEEVEDIDDEETPMGARSLRQRVQSRAQKHREEERTGQAIVKGSKGWRDAAESDVEEDEEV